MSFRVLAKHLESRLATCRSSYIVDPIEDVYCGESHVSEYDNKMNVCSDIRNTRSSS